VSSTHIFLTFLITDDKSDEQFVALALGLTHLVRENLRYEIRHTDAAVSEDLSDGAST
jgi:hypothetical protein